MSTPPRCRSVRPFAHLLVCGFAFGSCQLAVGQQTTYVWDGGAAAGGTANPTYWDTSTSNWSSATIPWTNDPANSIASFTGLASGTVTLNTAISANSILFSGSNAYSIGGGSGPYALTIGTGGSIVNSSSALQTISAAINFSGSMTIAGNGNTTITGPLINNGNSTDTLYIGDGASTGTVTLTSFNSSTNFGNTVVQSGTLALNGAYNNSVGVINGTVTIDAGATLVGQSGNAFGWQSPSQKINVLNIYGTVNTTAGNQDQGWALTVNLYGGTFEATNGYYALGGGSSINTFASSTTAVISAPIHIREGNANSALNVNVQQGSTPSGIDLNFSGPIILSAGQFLSLTGNGTTLLGNSGNQQKATYIGGGTLLLGNSGVLGTGTAYLGQSVSGATANARLLSNGSYATSNAIVVSGGSNVIGGNANANSSFSGPITINGGLMITQVATTGSNALNISGGISAASGGAQTVTFAGPGAINISGGAIADGAGGPIGVAITGGTTTFSSNNSYTGATTVSSGAGLNLIAGTSNTTSSLSVSDGGALSILGVGPSTATLTLAGLNLGSSSGANLNIALNGAPASAPLTISSAGGLVLAGTSNLTLSNSQDYSNGVIPLISYTGTPITSGLTLTPLPGRTQGTLDYSSPGLIQVDVTAGSIVWTGAINTTWDTGSSIGVGGTKNWNFNGTTNFIKGDLVVFNDTYSGTAVSPGTVVVTGAGVQPGSVIFNNNTTPYTLSGGAIADNGATPTSVTLNGTNSVTLNMANTYSGGTYLNAGRLNINNAAAIGSGTLTIGSGTVDNTSGAAITLSNNNAQAWNGNFNWGGSNALNTGTGTVTLGANVTITAAGASPAPLTVGGSILGSFGLTWSSTAGTLNLNGSNAFSGGLTITGGLLNIGSASALGSGPLTMQGGAFDNAVGSAVTIGNQINLSGSSTFVGTQTLTVSPSTAPVVTLGANSSLTLNGSTQTGSYQTANGSLVLQSGNTLISDGGNNRSLSISGTGTLQLLNGSSNFTGGTTIGSSTGTVTVDAGNGNFNEGGAPLGSGPITLNAGGILWAQPGSTGNTFNWANNFIFSGGTFDGEDGSQHLGTGGATITVNGPNTSSIQSNWGDKTLYIDGLLQGTGTLLLQHGLTGGTNAFIAITNPANTFSGIVGVSGAGNGITLRTGSTTLQFATVNTNPGQPSTVQLYNLNDSNGTNATFGALTGTAGTVQPIGDGNNYSLTLAGSTLSSTNTFGGSLSDNNGQLSLRISAANNANAVQILSGTSNYSGATSVLGGTLAVNGTIGGSGVGIAGGTLAGGGNVNTSVGVNTGGILRGGLSDGGVTTSYGTLTVNGPVTVNSGGSILTEVKDTTGGLGGLTGGSLISLGSGSALNLSPAGGKLNISILDTSTVTANHLASLGTYTINLASVNGGTINLNGSTVAAGTTFDSGTFTNSGATATSTNGTYANVNVTSASTTGFANSVSTWSLGVDSTGQFLQLTLTASPVPEPQHVLLIGFGALFAGLSVRRRLRLQASVA